MHVTCVVGARPNFMKVAALLTVAREYPDVTPWLVHTGQHYDSRMSESFFQELDLPRPDIHLGVGSGTHAAQTARVMLHFDEALEAHPTDLIIVVGDVNSTLACALVAAKRRIPVAHVEAGLRSRDRNMPEEINRILTDQISDFLFTSERNAGAHLLAEGILEDRIHFVGNVMIDTLLRHRRQAQRSTIMHELGLTRRGYAVSTLHRPSNVDTLECATNTVAALCEVAARLPVIFPLHPRTGNKLQQHGLLNDISERPNIHVVEPLGYFDFLALVDNACLVLTDSGGVQEETTALSVPCLTFRENTERPITVTEGTNQVVGTDPRKVGAAIDELLSAPLRSHTVPEFWDGRAAERIWSVLREHRPKDTRDVVAFGTTS